MPRPTRRRRTQQAKRADNTDYGTDSDPIGDIDLDNQPYRGKISNKPSPAHRSQRRRRVPSLAEDVQRIDNEVPTDEKIPLHRQANLLKSIVDLLSDGDKTRRKSVWMIVGRLVVMVLLFIFSFTFGHYIGYLGSDITLINTESLKSLAVRINEESWKKDSSLCMNTVREVDDVIWSASLLTPKYWKSVAIDFTNNEKQISAILVHYAAVLMIIRKNPVESRGEEFYNELADHTFLARRSLQSIKNPEINVEVLLCARSLWLAITQRIVKEYVKEYDIEVFRQAWYNVHLALTYAELKIWPLVKERSSDAINILDKAFGQDKKKYEVYGWAMYIYLETEFILSEKKHVPDTAASTTVMSELFGSVQDRIDDDAFPKLLLLLFPYRYA